ncbi:DUF3592 domain-containing protein [uncultured Acetatifactor sp.]|jgi:cytochrome bd-type quinol oxidase subunit 1|uniref:DUF3592 domain-containing protein n=1 Tax=uncultured Acetatifactor sp. TaxID=1671927 RepID=UPI0025EC81BE|nr:DUF3592 domain-containing protein [uncultured Acetatifactor sp.]MCI9650269.1 DUF3592 domain-containing protein [Lachnospiraceae bacterium]
MKQKRNSFMVLFCGIFLVVGAIFSAVGITMALADSGFRERAEEITAEITGISSYRASDGDRRHNVYVTYQYDGRVYEDIELNFYRSGMYEGQEIPLLCDPENPGHVKSPGGMLLLEMVFLLIGILFMGIALVFIAVSRNKARRRKKILSSGKRLSAIVEQIAVNTSYVMNGRNPYQIYCYYRDEYKDVIYRFKSEDLWINPNVVLQPGDTIDVYVDGEDYSRYHVDAESILDKKVKDYT